MNFAFKRKAKVLLLSLAVMAVDGCAISNVRLYGGGERARPEYAVIAAQGLNSSERYSIQVTEIEVDGKVVKVHTGAGLEVDEGRYRLKSEVRSNAAVDYAAQGLSYSYDGAIVDQVISVKAGHTYIPVLVKNSDGSITVVFEDVGDNFPDHCLPFYRVVSALRHQQSQCDIKGLPPI